ncbi:MAG TPA: hypothetical protein VK590_06560 [Saprospiraceae bacterium]|nr:hypothetical protein [Saprospiraceae bacterium]
MKLQERIEALIELGVYLNRESDALNVAIHEANLNNGWFTEDNIRMAIKEIVSWLQRPVLQQWLEKYDIKESFPQKIGLILAGNIPMVGFHDVLCVFITGNISCLKYSEKDNILIQHCIDHMAEHFPETKLYFDISGNFKDIQAIIATGSNNSANIFTSYFKHIPRIIRRNRNGIAVLTGNETDEDLISLGKDVFSYFGLGCRNVSKLYVPNDYSFDKICSLWYDHYKDVSLNNKYKNNFDYNYAIYLLNKEAFLANECIILKEVDKIASPISCLHYSIYENQDDLIKELISKKEEIQLIISTDKIPGLETEKRGQAQHPKIDQYADDVDTILFLSSLSS